MWMLWIHFIFSTSFSVSLIYWHFTQNYVSGVEVEKKQYSRSAQFQYSRNDAEAREAADENGEKFIYTRKQFPSDERRRRRKK